MKKINRYNVYYNGKKVVVRAETAEQAIDKYLDRPVFGSRNWNGGFKVDMIDSDTWGVISCSGTERWYGKQIVACMVEYDEEDDENG